MTRVDTCNVTRVINCITCQSSTMLKYTVVLLAALLHSTQGLCFLNKCSSWWNGAKNNVGPLTWGNNY